MATLTRSFRKKLKQSLTPRPDESQSAFFERGMRSLTSSIHSLNARAATVLRAWCRSPNAKALFDKAADRFPSDKFVHYGPRCVFIEHNVAADPERQRAAIIYDRKALQHLVDWANYRIADSGTFAAISEGHTPSEEERSAGAVMPDVLGYAGPFYLGQLGDLDPKWAIYADEWAHRDDVARFEKRQRRSPEVWIDEPIERRTMDPIAALGAETPRLDSGMNAYCRASDGQTVMRYSAATLPGPYNVSLPVGARERRPFRNSGRSLMTDNVDDDDGKLTAAVATALESLLPSLMQAVKDHLAFDDAPTADADNPDEAPPEDTSTPDEAHLDDEERDRYSAMSPSCQQAYLAGRQHGAMSYSRPQSEGDLHGVVARQQVRLQEMGEQLTRERRDASRYMRLAELSRDFAFEPHDEFSTCSEMSDAQFERHCAATIQKYSKRQDVTGLELFEDPDHDPERYRRGAPSRISVEQVERYSREAALLAARKNATKRGSTTFETEFAALCKQHGVQI